MARLRLLPRRGRRIRGLRMRRLTLPQMRGLDWDTARRLAADRGMGKTLRAADRRAPVPGPGTRRARVLAVAVQAREKDAAGREKVREVLRDEAQELERARVVARARDRFRESRFREEKTPATSTTLLRSRSRRRLLMA